VIDTDIPSPGIHVLFGLPGDEITSSLNDYLGAECEIGEAARDVAPQANGGAGGRSFLIPSSTKPGEIRRSLREGYDAQRLTQGLRLLVDELELDVLLIDTHPGLHEATLLSARHLEHIADRDATRSAGLRGPGIILRVAQGLEVPRMGSQLRFEREGLGGGRVGLPQ
jgi:MinD-like ATPase involved in chromosome partitioning or flagellar assembly